MSALRIERLFEMPRKWTFQMPKLRAWVESHIEGSTLNLFGGVVRLSHPSGGMIDHNDINTTLANREEDFNLDAFDLTHWGNFRGVYDTVIFDPPYSAHQAVVSYGVKKQQRVSHARDVVEFVLAPRGRVVSLGFNSTGMSMSRGFEKEDILLVNCGGSHNDYIVMSERRR